MQAKKTTQGKKRKADPGEPPSFEAALHRLEEIVSQLEHAEAPLEKALRMYEEGVRLAAYCSQQLREAERRVEILEDKNGRLSSRPFPGGEAGTAASRGTGGGEDAEEEAEDEDADETDAAETEDVPGEEESRDPEERSFEDDTTASKKKPEDSLF